MYLISPALMHGDENSGVDAATVWASTGVTGSWIGAPRLVAAARRGNRERMHAISPRGARSAGAKVMNLGRPPCMDRIPQHDAFCSGKSEIDSALLGAQAGGTGMRSRCSCACEPSSRLVASWEAWA